MFLMLMVIMYRKRIRRFGEHQHGGPCLKSLYSSLDTVSTTRGVGQAYEFKSISKIARLMSNPPATAGGTDCIQQRCSTFEARPQHENDGYGFHGRL